MTAKETRMLCPISVFVWICLIAASAQAKYSGGTGEPNDPYEITTARDLMLLGETTEDYDKHFILTADIDLDPNLPGRKVFDKAVIAADTNDIKDGFQGTSFTGVFDGAGHAISHLIITGASYLGLFGRLESGSEVKNLGVLDLNIAGSGDRVGGLMGDSNGAVTNCYSTGAVSGDYSVGGLIGGNGGRDEWWRVPGGIVTQCSTAGTVSGSGELADNIGGLVGTNGFGTVDAWCGDITKSYSTAVVSGKIVVGGLVGRNDMYSTVTMSYSSGKVTGTEFVGGLVGENHWDIDTSYSTSVVNGNYCVGGLAGGNSGTVTLCSSRGEVSADGGSVGGLIGSNNGVVARCSATGNVNGITDVGGLVGSNEDAVIQCYSKGTVEGESGVGGLIGSNGKMAGRWGDVSNYYSTGDVKSSSFSGGLAGGGIGTLTRCYSTGAVSGSYVGGLMGGPPSRLTAIACFWDTETSGQTASPQGTGKRTSEMQTASTFLDAGWDFIGETANGTEDIWWILEGQDYPRLWWERGDEASP